MSDLEPTQAELRAILAARPRGLREIVEKYDIVGGNGEEIFLGEQECLEAGLPTEIIIVDK